MNGRLTVGEVSLLIAAVTSAGGSLVAAVRAYAGIDESILFFERFANILSRNPLLTSGHLQAPHLTRAIEVRGISFRYSDNAPLVLEGLSLTIPAGKCVALVGANGSGKSTLVKLLTKMYDPLGGEICWDGQDIRAFEITSLRKRVGVVFQDFLRYDMSARDNIQVGRVDPQCDHAAVEAAAMKAGVHDAILQLEHGYDTMLSKVYLSAENGQGTDLSLGQWQKLATARMYVRSADFLILDEPTMALDPQSEYRLFRDFAALAAGRTALLVSHRFTTIRIADFIAVLDDGRVTEFGTHHELVALGGLYNTMYSQHKAIFDRD